MLQEKISRAFQSYARQRPRDLHSDDDDDDAELSDLENDPQFAINWDKLLSKTMSQCDFDVASEQFVRHTVLAKLLLVPEAMRHVFEITCAIADKMTKPANNDTFNMSLDLSANLVLLFESEHDDGDDLMDMICVVIERLMSLLHLRHEGQFYDAKMRVLGAGGTAEKQAEEAFTMAMRNYGFEMKKLPKSVKKGTIAEKIEGFYTYCEAKNVPEETPASVMENYTNVLQYTTVYSREYHRDWLPLGLNGLDQELLHAVLAILSLAAYKAASHHVVHPRIGLFARVWEATTRNLRLGVALQNHDDDMCGPGMPWQLRNALKGYSFVRCVAASILTGNLAKHVHDFAHESLNNAMIVFGRKVSTGSLGDKAAAVRVMLQGCGRDYYALEQLSSSDDVMGLDEDVMYIFECEFEGDEDEEDEEVEEEDASVVSRSVYVKKEYTAHCMCEYDDDDDVDDNDDDDDDDEIYQSLDNLDEEESDFEAEQSDFEADSDSDSEVDSLSSSSSIFETGVALQNAVSQVAVLPLRDLDKIARTFAKVADNDTQLELEATKSIADSVAHPYASLADVNFDFLEGLFARSPQTAVKICDSALSMPITQPAAVRGLSRCFPRLQTIDYVHAVLSGRSHVTIDHVTAMPLFFGFVQTASEKLAEHNHSSNVQNSHAVLLLCVMIKSLADQHVIDLSLLPVETAVKNLLLPWLGEVAAARDLFFRMRQPAETTEAPHVPSPTLYSLYYDSECRWCCRNAETSGHAAPSVTW